MKTFSQEEISSRYERLPRRVRDALFASATTDKMLEIGKRHGLLLDKVGVLAEETGYVMLGLTPPQTFASRLSEGLGITQAQAEAVVADINGEVFREIQDNLKTTPDDAPETFKEPERPKSFATTVQKNVAPPTPQEPIQPKPVTPLQPPTIKSSEPEQKEKPVPSMIFPQKGGSTIPEAPKFEEEKPNPPKEEQKEQSPVPILSTPKQKTPAGDDPYREPIE